MIYIAKVGTIFKHRLLLCISDYIHCSGVLALNQKSVDSARVEKGRQRLMLFEVELAVSKKKRKSV